LLIRALGDLVPSDRLITNPSTLEGLSRDQTSILQPGIALAAAYPITTDEVAAIVGLCADRRVPIVPRGAGSGLAGGANASDGCLILCLERMNRIVEIDVDDLSAVVQPGVINATLAKAVGEAGLFYAPDPSSFEISSIGGNLATNAGGLRCLKYGVTRESVLELEVVLADGSVLRCGKRSLKGVAGYDLVSLFVGSEGTLGVITEARLRLRPKPQAPGTLIASFATLEAAAEAVATIGRSGAQPSVLELMDRTTVRAIEDWRHLGLDTDAAVTLIAGSDGPDHGSLDLDEIEGACRSTGASQIIRSTDRLESEGLMAARRAAFPALERMGATLLEDVAVPRFRMTDLVSAIEAIGARHDVVIGTFGHAGDGNLHPTLVWERGDAEAQRRAERAADEILRRTLALGGTLSGEHGIGQLKRDLLAQELGPVGTRVTRSIKDALDPLGILNPGKVLPRVSDQAG
jgi:glycolate oxidase